ncbi:hypothetical protein CDV31_013459 [Fusarium ambrosium]|uniref:Uncharacterized protein n=1 Tax=Fusarium ambrosium TaxID=131363 RepID=A0A428T364_9HYPO|nr:hypothetical protein CDV31_013459 [Fusarium ambrosium]
MCRHTEPKTICGVDPQYYADKIRAAKRFRLYLCKSTQADIAHIIAQGASHVTPKALARGLGLDLGHGSLGRVLLNKFVAQVKYVEKSIRRGQAQGPQRSTAQSQAMPAETGTILPTHAHIPAQVVNPFEEVREQKTQDANAYNPFRQGMELVNNDHISSLAQALGTKLSI